MTNPVQSTEQVTVVVSDLANGTGANVQVTVDKGTAIKSILDQAGVSVREGQEVNFLGNPASPDLKVTQSGMASVTANTKAAS